MSRYQWKNIDKVGLGIVAFEGTEHLANIISELRDVVDYVSIGLQRKSYHGDPIEPIDLQEIIRLKEEDMLVDEIVEIDLDGNKEPRVQETDKRNLLIQDAEDHGCSHVIIIDSDEYYTKNSFLHALKEIDDNNYEITYCQYVNYYSNSYKHFLVYPFDQGMFVPFVSRTKYRHSFECQDFNKPSDPTRRYVRPFDGYKEVTDKDGNVHKLKNYTVDYHIFPWNIVKMHHLSWVRADIRKKVNMWSSKTCFKNYNDLIDKAVDVYNHFDINSTEQTKASLLFNTPNHEVYVRPFPKQYIHPKFDITTRLRPVKSYKKIVIMNLSTTNSDIHLFEKLEEKCRKTWAKDVIDKKYSNIEYWMVIDCKEDSHIDKANMVIYIKTDYTKDNTQQLLNRWLEAYQILVDNGYKYDWILRTNTSTWCNIEWINEFLSYETDDSVIYTYQFLSAFWSTFNIFCSGAAMLWPCRNLPILINLVNSTSESVLSLALDDVMMSALWRKRAQQIGLTNPNECFHSLEGKYLNQPYTCTDMANVDPTIPLYQIKTFLNENGEANVSQEERLVNDLAKMESLQVNWEFNRANLDIDAVVQEYRRNRMDKSVYTIKYSKTEWINGGLTDEEKKRSLFENVMPYNQETLDWLERRAAECGYKH